VRVTGSMAARMHNGKDTGRVTHVTDSAYCLCEVPSRASVRSDDFGGNNSAGGVIYAERIDFNGQQV
jgi:hypothetical protein